LRPWLLTLAPFEGDARPRFLQIAHAVARDIQSGRLRPGDKLPGTRTLAKELNLHRNTVAAAYDELRSEGWIEASRGKGTIVSRDLPEVAARPPRVQASHDARVGYPLERFASPADAPWPEPRSGVLALAGIADGRLLPMTEFARAYRRAALSLQATAGHYPSSSLGHPRLIRALKEMLATTRGISRERGLIVTRGSQMGLFLLVEYLLRPGDVVAVENPGYAFGWEAFRRKGVRLVPVPIDGGGLRIDALREIVRHNAIRAVFTTPNVQYPTTVTLTPGRRRELLALAAEHRIVVVEDDFVHEYRYDGRPVLPLAAQDRDGVVIYLGSLSKVFMPGPRLGYVVAPTPVIEGLAWLRELVDVCGDPILEVAMAELVAEGVLQRHVWRMRKIFEERRDALAQAMRSELGGVVRFRPPAGGPTVWCEVDVDIDVAGWVERAKARGVWFNSGSRFFLHEARPSLSLSFVSLAPSELREAVRRMARGLADLRSRK